METSRERWINLTSKLGRSRPFFRRIQPKHLDVPSVETKKRDLGLNPALGFTGMAHTEDAGATGAKGSWVELRTPAC